MTQIDCFVKFVKCEVNKSLANIFVFSSACLFFETCVIFIFVQRHVYVYVCILRSYRFGICTKVHFMIKIKSYNSRIDICIATYV